MGERVQRERERGSGARLRRGRGLKGGASLGKSGRDGAAAAHARTLRRCVRLEWLGLCALAHRSFQRQPDDPVGSLVCANVLFSAFWCLQVLNALIIGHFVRKKKGMNCVIWSTAKFTVLVSPGDGDTAMHEISLRYPIFFFFFLEKFFRL